MVRSVKQCCLLLVTIDAGIAAYKTRSHFLRRFLIAISQNNPDHNYDSNQRKEDSKSFHRLRFFAYSIEKLVRVSLGVAKDSQVRLTDFPV